MTEEFQLEGFLLVPALPPPGSAMGSDEAALGLSTQDFKSFKDGDSTVSPGVCSTVRPPSWGSNISRMFLSLLCITGFEDGFLFQDFT